MTDEELIRQIAQGRAATPREKELAKRMNRLLYSFDALEELLFEEEPIDRRMTQ